MNKEANASIKNTNLPPTIGVVSIKQIVLTYATDSAVGSSMKLIEIQLPLETVNK